MLPALTNHEEVERLIADGYEVCQYPAGYLVIKGIPYVTEGKEIRTDGVLGTPLANVNDHVAYWSGSIPCDISGSEIKNLVHERDIQSNRMQIPNCSIRFGISFSNKPDSGFQDYYCKMTSYINIISAPACSLDHSVTPKMFKPSSIEGYETPLKFQDVSSIRYNLSVWNDILGEEKVAIIGLGGTGTYLLDFISKTHVKEIHLFDDDFFETHNAFRAPGAWSAEELSKREYKVNVFAGIYSKLRNGIVPHTQKVTSENINLFSSLGITTVFICIDSGYARKRIVEYVQIHGICCIDCGIDASFRDENRISGAVRASYISSTIDYSGRLPFQDFDDHELDVYSSNIQLAELNAINAAFAVILWKQKRGLYVNPADVAQINYSCETQCGIQSMNEIPNDRTVQM